MPHPFLMHLGACSEGLACRPEGSAGSGGAGASTAAPRRALRPLPRYPLRRPRRSRPELRGQDHGQRLRGPPGRLSSPYSCSPRETREAVESPKEPETLQIAHVENKVPLSLSARASQSAPPRRYLGGALGMET